MGGQIFCPNLSLTHTTPQFVLGQEYVSPLGAIYKYVKGGATIAAYEFCVLSKDGAYTTVLLDTDTSGHGSGKVQPLVCPQVALTSSLYGWAFAGNGYFTGKAALNCAQDVPLYATSTGGVVDDSATTTLIPGLSVITTITTAAATPMHAAGRLFIAGI